MKQPTARSLVGRKPLTWDGASGPLTIYGDKMKAKDFIKPKEKKKEGKKIDPVAALKKAYAKPGYAKEVGGRGYV